MSRIKHVSRILDRRDNIVAVDFRGPTDPQPPAPVFPGAASAPVPRAENEDAGPDDESTIRYGWPMPPYRAAVNGSLSI